MKLSIVDQSPVPAGRTSAEALRNTIELARLAEALGYHRYWIAEHHATAAFASPAPEIMIARVAAETSAIRVGSGGVMLPHYSPMKVVEQFKVLHALYPGASISGWGARPAAVRWIPSPCVVIASTSGSWVELISASACRSRSLS